jgi:hypothetical protein
LNPFNLHFVRRVEISCLLQGNVNILTEVG